MRNRRELELQWENYAPAPLFPLGPGLTKGVVVPHDRAFWFPRQGLAGVALNHSSGKSG